MSLLGVLTGVRGEVNTYGVFHKLLHIAGIYVGSVAMFEALVRALEANRIDPIIDRTFGFGEAREAYAYLASGAHFGKVVIRID
jgi:NADPH:quinone reductase-like Zn-dependent oxidoreductase